MQFKYKIHKTDDNSLSVVGLNPLSRDIVRYLTNAAFITEPLLHLYQVAGTGRICHALFAILEKPLIDNRWVIFIRASHRHQRELPQIRIDQRFVDALFPLAQRLNPAVIWLQAASKSIETTFDYNLNTRGEHFKMSASLCDNFAIPFHDIGPQERTPRLALVAGPYNELNGLFVLVRLADFLNQIYSGQRSGQHLRERVIIIPAVNLAGTSIRSPDWLFNRSDINGILPDDEMDEIIQRITIAVLKATRQAYYRVDLHASNLVEEVPQVRLYEPTDDERASACLFGLPAVIEQPINTVLSTHWVRTWRQYGGENFVIQGGQAGNLQTVHCEVLFRALVAFLDRTGIADGLILSEEEENLRYFGVHQTFAVLSEHSGIFVSRLEVGRWVQAGECLGLIYHGFTGEFRIEINAPVSGLVSTLRRQPLLCEGDFVARILTTERSGG